MLSFTSDLLQMQREVCKQGRVQHFVNSFEGVKEQTISSCYSECRLQTGQAEKQLDRSGIFEPVTFGLLVIGSTN